MKPFWLMMTVVIGMFAIGCGGSSDPAADAKVGEDTGTLTPEQKDMEKAASKAAGQ